MNINNIRNDIICKRGKKLLFKYFGNRGQNEEFEGEIVNIYKGIFLIKSFTDERIRSFSYSDVLIGNLEIDDC